MIYSSWRPDRGGYDYFEVPDRHGIGDDLPTPHQRASSPIGVPSVEAGRPIPSGARPAGSGQLARGMVAPINRRGLAGGDDAAKIRAFFPLVGMLTVGILAGVWLADYRAGRG